MIDDSSIVAGHRDLERKVFAMHVKVQIDRSLQPVAFRALDGTPPFKGLMELLGRAAHSETRVDAVTPLFGMEWRAPDSIE